MTLPAVRDESGYPPGSPGWVRGPTGRSATGRWTLREVWNGSGDPQEDPGWVGGIA